VSVRAYRAYRMIALSLMKKGVVWNRDTAIVKNMNSDLV
jgi:hypothetical protein